MSSNVLVEEEWKNIAFILCLHSSKFPRCLKGINLSGSLDTQILRSFRSCMTGNGRMMNIRYKCPQKKSRKILTQVLTENLSQVRKRKTHAAYVLSKCSQTKTWHFARKAVDRTFTWTVQNISLSTNSALHQCQNVLFAELHGERMLWMNLGLRLRCLMSRRKRRNKWLSNLGKGRIRVYLHVRIVREGRGRKLSISVWFVQRFKFVRFVLTKTPTFNIDSSNKNSLEIPGNLPSEKTQNQ